MNITPINEAEAIIEPFWDGQQNGLSDWEVDPGPDHGLTIYQEWDTVAYEWTNRPVSGSTLRMRRTCDLACNDYNRLVLSVMPPPDAVVRLMAETDRGQRRLETPPARPKKKELVLDLEGATRLKSVTIEIDAGTEGIARGWFNWIGLQNSGRLTHMLSAQGYRDTHWDKHLKDESFRPSFSPRYGLVLNTAELELLRERHNALTAAGQTSPFALAGERAQTTSPEELIQDYVSFGGDSRYNRERDHGRQIISHGLNAAIAGHLLQDPGLLRLSARYALSIGMCKNWDDGFICRFPGGTWDHRCFVQSLCAYDVAAILDLAGEYFTDLGRNFLLRRLAEEAISAIQYNTWVHEYIFHCNQLAWFTPGRMLALSVLERHWPRVRPYLDIAYGELYENMEASILSDGGYVEGPSYFLCVGRDAGLGLYYYSRATGKPMMELIPPAMKRCGAFADALISTDEAHDMIPICDSSPLHPTISQVIMAGLLPGSSWARMLNKSLPRHKGWTVTLSEGDDKTSVPRICDAAIAWGLMEEIALESNDPAPFQVLPNMGPIVSHRRLDGHWIKLFIQGNRAGAGHTHEDKGSFVLEFAGDTFAMDPGTCDYSHPLALVLKNCERHNMLVPYGMSERPAPQCPLQYDVKPKGHGDETVTHVEIDATPGWDAYYRHWHRTWDSPSLDRLTITDNYELATGEGVEFYWQTLLPVTIDSGQAIITGRSGRVELEAPEECVWRIDKLPLLNGVQNRIALRCSGTSGVLTIQVRLISGDGA